MFSYIYYTLIPIIIHTHVHHSQVKSSSDTLVQLAPPPIGVPTIIFTSAGGCSGSALFVPDSSYQLTDTVENDVYTFTVTVTNAAGPSSETSDRVVGKLYIFFAVMRTTYIITLQ